jgi:hypothetical protein
MSTIRRSMGDGKRTTAESVRSRAPVLGLFAAAALSGGCATSPTVSTTDLGAPFPVGPRSAIQPIFAPTVTASVPPPPISGGTLIVTNDGTLAVVSDPDRDAVYVVDLGAQKVSHTIALHAGDEPGRLVEDGAGRVQVALRGGGALVTIDPGSGSVITRRSVCPAPRGVAWDASTDLVWVACATGELVALPSAGGSSARSLVLERDLRDVVISNGSLSVTNFRTAEVLRVASDGSISRRDQLPSPVSTFTPHVAWRVIGTPSGAVVAVHQAESTQSLSTVVQGGYGGGACGGFRGAVADDAGNPSAMEDAGPGVDVEASGNCFAGAPGVGVPGGPTGGGVSLPVGGCAPESGAVLSVLTVLTAGGTVTVNTSFAGVLPVDVAVSKDGSFVAAVAPGNAFAPLSTVFEFTSCGSPVSQTPSTLLQQPIAVAFDSKDDLLVQTREPAQLSIISSGGTTTIPLSTTTRADTGYDVFHTQAGGMIACASCHPEGRDDGFVWTLDGDRRRTPSLRGTIAGTAPYHWPGDEPNLNVLVNDVYTVRMSGASLSTDQMGAITSWVQQVSPPPGPSWVDAASAQRGQALFESASTGCATCHSGAKFTNNLTMDVGTGGNFQVPPLVGVGWRAPFMHDGCAATLADRFGACATPQHGSTGTLSSQDISDLVAYLETL